MIMEIKKLVVLPFLILLSCKVNLDEKCKKVKIVKIQDVEFFRDKDSVFLNINFYKKLEIDSLYIEYGFQEDSINKGSFFLSDTLYTLKKSICLKFPHNYFSKSFDLKKSNGTILIYSKPLIGNLLLKKNKSKFIKCLYFNYRIRKQGNIYKVKDNQLNLHFLNERVYCDEGGNDLN